MLGTSVSNMAWLGVKIDIEKAKEYYCTAIEMGNEEARKCLENIK